MLFFRDEKLTLQTGMTEHHKGWRLPGLEVHGPAAIGMGRFMGDIEMLALMAFWFVFPLLFHLVPQFLSF